MNQKKRNKNQKVRQKSAVSVKDRKRNKYKLEQLTKMNDLDVSSIIFKNHANRSISFKTPSSFHNTLKYKKLLAAEQRDEIIKHQIQTGRETTEDAMLRQIKAISDFTI